MAWRRRSTQPGSEAREASVIILLGLAIMGGFVVLVLLWRMRDRRYTRTGYRGRI